LGYRGRRRKDEPVERVREFVVSGTIGGPDPPKLERAQQLQRQSLIAHRAPGVGGAAPKYHCASLAHIRA